MENCDLVLSNQLSEIFDRDVIALNGVFGINHIGLIRIYLNNYFFYSCNNKRLILEYYKHVKGSKVFFQEDILLNHAGKKEYAILWPRVSDHYSMDLYLRYGYWHGISYVCREKDYVDLWWVAKSLESKHYENIEHIKLIHKYILSLRDRCKDCLSMIAQNNLWCFKDGMDLINLERLGSHNPILSAREQACFTLINKGYSMKQIASELKISVNTVSTYILRLKQKLNVNYKSELINIFNHQHLNKI